MTLRERIGVAVRDYRRSPSNARLRLLLTLKAQARIFDRRMCGYYGVDHRVNLGCRRAICRAYAAGLVPTSTTGGSHARTSWHYVKQWDAKWRAPAGCAVDLGVRQEDHPGSTAAREMLERFQRTELARFRRGSMKGDLVELLGPANALVVLRDAETDLVEGTPLETQHDTHVHEAYRR